MENCKRTEAEQKLLALLSETHKWPGPYLFRFIVPCGEIENLKKILAAQNLVIKPSAKGNYLAVNYTVDLPSGEAVLEIYQKVKCIKGLVAL